MLDLRKAGAIAAGIDALAYLVGFAVMATLLDPGDTAAWSQAQKLAFVVERHAAFQAWTIVVYVLAGIALVVLAVALHGRLAAGAPALMRITSAFGLIWAGLVIGSGMIAIVGLDTVATLHQKDVAQATLAWIVIGTVQNGLGGGIEIVGGVWVLLVSLAALRCRALPRALNYLGVLVGLAGILSVVPALGALVELFGLSQIVWFIGIAAALSRSDAPAEPQAALAAADG